MTMVVWEIKKSPFLAEFGPKHKNHRPKSQQNSNCDDFSSIIDYQIRSQSVKLSFCEGYILQISKVAKKTQKSRIFNQFLA